MQTDQAREIHHRRANARRFVQPAIVALATCLVWAGPAGAQDVHRPGSALNLLRDLNASVEELTTRVSESVVQVLATGYGPVDDQGGDASPVIGLQRNLGSGAIVDTDGYIVTNAHVVAGARHVQVVLHTTSAAGGATALRAEPGRTVDARIVGVANDIDLALLKVDVPGLHPLPLADYGALRQGEIVFAFGSPEGLRDSVTMGVISSVARQPDPDNPTIYIQTDAPINKGNSGGPLVNVEGELVGLNTFILSESGGSQGLGFAIPSAVVASAYPQLRKYGHLHRGMVGLNLQSITPALAAGLGLPVTSGVVVSDVMPTGPADVAGVEVADVIASINGKPVDSVPMLSLELGLAASGDKLRIGLMRKHDVVSVNVVVAERPHPIDELSEMSDPEKNAVPALGIIGADVTDDTGALLPGLRIPSGVFVTARTQLPRGTQVPLLTGDVIHAVNGLPVRSLDGLRVLIEHVSRQRGLVLQVERDGELKFVVCDTN